MTLASAVPLTGSDQAIARSHYFGFVLRETVGGAAVVRVHDGTDNSGPILDDISLAAGESAREFYPGGIRAVNGIYVDIVSGTVEGSIRIG